MKLEFCRQILVKHSNIKFHENPFSRSRVVPRGRKDRRKDRERQKEKKTDRQTDRQDKANSRFSQFLQTHLERLAEGILIKSNINNLFGRVSF